MTDNKKDKPRLGRGLSALISNPIINNNENIESGNTALNVNSIFAKNFEKGKAREFADKTKGVKKTVELDDLIKIILCKYQLIKFMQMKNNLEKIF